MKKPFTEDDECYNIDNLDETINEETHVLLENDQLDSFLLNNLEKTITQSDQENCNPIVNEFIEDSEINKSIRRIDSVNTVYSDGQENEGVKNIRNEHLYSANANEIDDKKPELKDLPSHLEYEYLHNNESFPVIISSKLSEKVKRLLLINLSHHGQLMGQPYSCCSKEREMTVVLNDNNELIPSRTVTGWMPFGLCNAPATFQRCMMAIFHDMVEDFMEVSMDDFFVFGQRIDEKIKPIYYASKTLNNAQEHYITTEKELLAVVFSFDKFGPYLILSKYVVYTDHSALKYLFSKQDAKHRLIRWVLLLQGFNIEIKDKKGAKNLTTDHLSRLENPQMEMLTEREIADEFPDEH
ncbi:reverse transcriptase domain-containing protein [Tanacetum coccineum]